MSSITKEIPKVVGHHILLKCIEKNRTEGGIYVPTGDGVKKVQNTPIDQKFYVEGIGPLVDESIKSDLHVGQRVHIDFIPSINSVVDEWHEEDGSKVALVTCLPQHIKCKWNLL